MPVEEARLLFETVVLYNPYYYAALPARSA